MFNSPCKNLIIDRFSKDMVLSFNELMSFYGENPFLC
jgi:hypothetical protein